MTVNPVVRAREIPKLRPLGRRECRLNRASKRNDGLLLIVHIYAIFGEREAVIIPSGSLVTNSKDPEPSPASKKERRSRCSKNQASTSGSSGISSQPRADRTRARTVVSMCGGALLMYP